jgi:hypothetical protein
VYDPLLVAFRPEIDVTRTALLWPQPDHDPRVIVNLRLAESDGTVIGFRSGRVRGASGSFGPALQPLAIGETKTFESYPVGFGDPAGAAVTIVPGRNYSLNVEILDADIAQSFFSTTPCTATGPADCAAHPEADPVHCYAPEVRLHPLETLMPIGTNEFVLNSKLKSVHDQGCVDDTMAEEHQIDLGLLPSGGYTSSANAPDNDGQGFLDWGRLRCSDTSPRFTTAQMTRPGSGDGGSGTPAAKRPEGLAKSEGFTLDLADSARGGTTPTEDNPVPVTYTFHREPGSTYITYWLFYAFNEPGTLDHVAGITPVPDGFPRIIDWGNFDRHEGDWERVVVHLDPLTNRATRIGYFQHGCNPEDVPISDVEITDTGHPIVYSAWGSHASYPHAGMTARPCPEEGGEGALPAMDWHSDLGSGVRWHTWDELQEDVDQPWFGYRGGWGQYGTTFNLRGWINVPDGDTNQVTAPGPLGPPEKVGDRP